MAALYPDSKARLTQDVKLFVQVKSHALITATGPLLGATSNRFKTCDLFDDHIFDLNRSRCTVSEEAATATSRYLLVLKWRLVPSPVVHPKRVLTLNGRPTDHCNAGHFSLI